MAEDEGSSKRVCKGLKIHAEEFRLKVGGKWELLPVSEWRSDKTKTVLGEN